MLYHATSLIKDSTRNILPVNFLKFCRNYVCQNNSRLLPFFTSLIVRIREDILQGISVNSENILEDIKK